MAVSKAPQPFMIEPMRARTSTRSWRSSGCRSSPPGRAGLLEEMVRDWAHVDVVRDAASGSVGVRNYWLVADEMHILNLATHPQARRAGHASRLLAHMIDFGRRTVCRIVTLEVRRSNAAALRLYRRFAFRAGRRSPELLRRGPGRRHRHAAGLRADAMTPARRCCRSGWRSRAWRSGGARRAGARRRVATHLARRHARAAVAITFDACATQEGRVRLRSRRCTTSCKREQVPATIFVSGRWVDMHARGDGRAGRRSPDRVRRPLVRSPAHVRASRRRATARRSTRPRRRSGATASTRSPFARRSATGTGASSESSAAGTCRRSPGTSSRAIPAQTTTAESMIHTVVATPAPDRSSSSTSTGAAGRRPRRCPDPARPARARVPLRPALRVDAGRGARQAWPRGRCRARPSRRSAAACPRPRARCLSRCRPRGQERGPGGPTPSRAGLPRAEPASVPRSRAPPALARAQASWIAALEPWRGLGYRADALGRYLARKAQAGGVWVARAAAARSRRSESSSSTTVCSWAGSLRFWPSGPRRAGRASGAPWSSTSLARTFAARRWLYVSCDGNNAAALRFYRKLGFSRVGRLPDLVREGADARFSLRRPAAKGDGDKNSDWRRQGRLPSGALMIGQQFGNYRALSLLGEGGMGAVYLAEHPAIGRRVAVKVLHKNYIRDENLLTPVPERGARRQRHPPPEHHRDPRLGDHRRRDAVPGDGAARGGEPRPAHPPRRRAADRRPPSSSATRRPRRWGRRTRRGSSTAISSPTTSSCVPRSASRSSRERIKVLDFGIAKLQLQRRRLGARRGRAR